MIKNVLWGGSEAGRSLAMTLALGAFLTTGGCSLVADFGSLDSAGADGGTGGDGGGSGNNTGGDGGTNTGADGGSTGDGGNNTGADGGTNTGVDGGTNTGADGGTTGDGGVDAGDAGCTPTFAAELIAEQSLSLCDNGIDDDCDGLPDCEDPDCYTLFACGCTTYNGPSEAVCDDGLDDDCKRDGVDCDDPDCQVPGSCGCEAATYEETETTCGDGVDNDCDGVADCDDEDCRLSEACCPDLALEGDTASCSDNTDNDCDGLVDCDDTEGCGGRLVCCVPADGQSGGETECGNAADDDCDGLVDCADPDCAADAACDTCVPSEATETDCDNGLDDDCDGQLDCADPDCVGTGAEEAPLCGDDRDNDCNGQSDCDDSTCTDTPACCVPAATEASEATCDDGRDNDCVGGIDCGDPKCGEATACCTPTDGVVGTIAEADSPMLASNGIDDDCNGLVDGARLRDLASFPHRGGAAAAADVAIVIAPNERATRVQCRSYLRNETPPEFGPCGNLEVTPAGLVHRPFPSGEIANGPYRIEVMWEFDGVYIDKESEVASYDVYVHDSLNDVKRCDEPGSPLAGVSDAELLKLAREYIVPGDYGTDPGASFVVTGPSADTALLNPFIKLTFDEPSEYSYDLSGTPATYQVTSLRRWFRLSADGEYLIMTRHYVSSRSGNCNAAGFRSHRAQLTGQSHQRFTCDAVVVHRNGVGVCINVASNSSISLGHSYRGMFYTSPRTLIRGWSVNANPVMGRQLVRRRPSSSTLENFSPKCWTSPACETVTRPYLPGVGLFDWTP